MAVKPQAVEDWPPANKRLHLRKPLMVLKAKLDDGRKPFFGYARNISRSGMFIASVNPRNPGEQFDIEANLPPLGLTLVCRCEVVWKRTYAKKSTLEPGMGLRFLDLPEEVAEIISRWVEENSVSAE